MSGNSDQSEASTSDSEDEFELLDQQEYERRRELYLSKIIFCERKYNEIKPALLKLRLDQLEKLQDGILNRKSEVYLTRKAALDGEFESKRNHVQIVRQLRLEALQRRVIADKWNASVNLRNNKSLAKATVQEAIQEKYDKLLMEQREVERITSLCFSGDNNTDRTSSSASMRNGKFSSNDISKYLGKKTNNGSTFWCNIPVLIAQLPKHKISEDLDLFKARENIAK